jgi:hypothetical protein
MIGEITSAGIHAGFTIETTLDPKIQPFLQDHQIDGTPVLPGVMGVEAFAEAALCLVPGWHVDAVEDVNFLAPFKFYRSEPRKVTLEVIIHSQGDAPVADCRLIGRRPLPNQAEPQVTTHFTGRVRLTKNAIEATAASAPRWPVGSVVKAADIYRIYFHGPAYQVLKQAWSDGSRMVGEMPETLPSNHLPSDRPTVMTPRLIELCFQTAGIWEMGVEGRMGLPLHIDQVRVERSQELAEGRVYAVVTPKHGSFDAEVVDAKGNRYVQMIGYRTVALPNAIDNERLKPLQAVMRPESVAA